MCLMSEISFTSSYPSGRPGLSVYRGLCTALHVPGWRVWDADEVLPGKERERRKQGKKQRKEVVTSLEMEEFIIKSGNEFQNEHF